MSDRQDEFAERFRGHLAHAGVPDPDTGIPLPITIGDLYRRLVHRYGTVPVSERHLFRLAAGAAWPRLDALWMLAEQFNVHPALLLGQGRPTPTVWPTPPDPLAPAAPNEITAPIAHALRQFVAPGKWSPEGLRTALLDSPHYRHRDDPHIITGHDAPAPISSRHVHRLLAGTAIPALSTIYALSEVLAIPAVDLAFGPAN